MAQWDQTAAVAIKGYAWLPDQRRQSGNRPVPLRVMGQRAVGIEGPAAVRFFYGDGHLERHTALPALVKSTLFGHGAVHTLDGDVHRARKAIFVSLLMNDGVEALAKLTGEAFDEAADGWRGGGPVTLFDETAVVVARAVTRWAGVPVSDADLPKLAADLVALVDGFATVGPRAWRAMAARGRRERWLSKLIKEAAPAADAFEAAGSTDPEGGSAQPGPADGGSHPRSPADGGSDPRSPADGRSSWADPAGEQSALAVLAAAGLPPRIAAVEMLNIIRPTTAVTWFLSFAAHALDRWPHYREQLRAGDDEFTRAFVHEVRRFYPFAPFLGGRAVRDLEFEGERIPRGSLVLLDVYGQNHDPLLFPQPYDFRPERFVGAPIGEWDLIPQGGGDPRTGHRCPGEQITVAVLGTLVQRLANLDYYLPPQNLDIDLSRIPAKPASGVQIVVP